jgi:xanthine dehydrogenase small subunit
MARQKSAKTASPHGAIRFALDGEIVTLDDVDPTRTVLQYLREDLGRTGTKEGCAEGDCGACTVVVGELKNGSVRFRAINSCIQFVPTLDGKELITVESLRGDRGALHPVQQALVDCHGSQCGFCTPGFVMSLFALYKSARRPSRRDINDALAGNLCRCTGYRPIVDAGCRMYEYSDAAGTKHEHWMNCSFSSPADGEPSASEREMIERLRAIRPHDTLSLTHGDRTYFAPSSLADLAALREAHPDARILAGGTDVGLWVTKQQRALPAVIYVGNVPELQRIEETRDTLHVGAAVSLTDAFAALVVHYPQLNDLCRRFASPPIRNAGTLGGNIANGSPIGDAMPVLLALGSTLGLRRGEHTREVPLEAFYVAYQKTALEPGEFLERVNIPLRDAATIVRSYKISKRFDQDISAVCAGYCLDVSDDVVRDARIAHGGLAAIPKRAPHCERALIGKPWTDETVRSAMSALDRDYAPLTDMRASAGYRRSITRNLLWRLFIETTNPRIATNVFELAESVDAE